MKKFLNLLIASLSTFIIYSLIETTTQAFVSDIFQTALVIGCAMYIIDNTIVSMLEKRNNEARNNYNNI